VSKEARHNNEYTKKTGGPTPIVLKLYVNILKCGCVFHDYIICVGTRNVFKKSANYLAEKILVKAREQSRDIVVTWGCNCQATHKDVSHLESNQEEADTKLLLHAVDATASGASKISIYSPDTDVLVLALRRYPELSKDIIICNWIWAKTKGHPSKTNRDKSWP
jgi:hypothetical protein